MRRLARGRSDGSGTVVLVLVLGLLAIANLALLVRLLLD